MRLCLALSLLSLIACDGDTPPSPNDSARVPSPFADIAAFPNGAPDSRELEGLERVCPARSLDGVHPKNTQFRFRPARGSFTGRGLEARLECDGEAREVEVAWSEGETLRVNPLDDDTLAEQQCRLSVEGEVRLDTGETRTGKYALDVEFSDTAITRTGFDQLILASPESIATFESRPLMRVGSRAVLTWLAPRGKPGWHYALYDAGRLDFSFGGIIPVSDLTYPSRWFVSPQPAGDRVVFAGLWEGPLGVRQIGVALSDTSFQFGPDAQFFEDAEAVNVDATTLHPVVNPQGTEIAIYWYPERVPGPSPFYAHFFDLESRAFAGVREMEAFGRYVSEHGFLIFVRDGSDLVLRLIDTQKLDVVREERVATPYANLSAIFAQTPVPTTHGMFFAIWLDSRSGGAQIRGLLYDAESGVVTWRALDIGQPTGLEFCLRFDALDDQIVLIAEGTGQIPFVQLEISPPTLETIRRETFGSFLDRERFTSCLAPHIDALGRRIVTFEARSGNGSEYQVYAYSGRPAEPCEVPLDTGIDPVLPVP